jgi:hypothetical protein
MEDNTYTLVYAPEKSQTNFSHHMYEVENPNGAEKLYNKGTQVGFVAKVKNRDECYRAFRFDRIVSLARTS